MEKISIPGGETLPAKSLPGILQSIAKKQTWSDATSIYTLAERLARLTTGYSPNSDSELLEASYYNYSVLKAPVWRWEIVWYFFFGGLAAGSYVVASIAALFGSQDDRMVARAGYYISLLALLPCPPLLIKDLGRPEKFLNMLRIFKVKSPMSMGVWGLLTFSFFSGLTASTQAARDGLLGRWWGANILARFPQKLLAVPGAGFGIFLGGYTGVLLAATSIPLWSRSKLLGAIFVTSALSTGTALISCVLRVIGAPSKSLRKLEQMEWVNMFVEIVGLLAFLRGSGRAARQLVGTASEEQGLTFWTFMFGGLILPWLMQTLQLTKKTAIAHRREHGWAGLVISLLVLVGGYFLRRTIVDAGRVSSTDAHTTLWNARH